VGIGVAIRRLALLLSCVVACAASPGHSAAAANDLSTAEKALFVDNHLAKLRPPQTLLYRFSKTGTLEPPFDDTVQLKLAALADGSCCAASAQFFTGPREMRQPAIEGAQGNPAILYFLERDIREMERLTKGKANYFRKRIRMAVFQSASMRTVSLPYKGQPVEVREITITPYVDDPLRPRYDKLANKTYVFMLSDGVPGSLYGIRTRIDAESPTAAALSSEAMLIDGAGP
jgi:hypothetical protein